MAAKQYTAVRGFRLVDPYTGDGTHYEPGDPYTGPVDKNPHLLGDGGDGGGPLIAEKKPSPDKSASDKSATEDTPALDSKEK